MPKTKEELEKEQLELITIKKTIEKKLTEINFRLIEINGILNYLKELKENDNNK